MGGASYDRDVYSSSDSSSSSGWDNSSSSLSNSSFSDPAPSSRSSSYSRSAFSYSKKAAEELNDSVLDESLFPRGRTLTCTAQTGIVVMLDLTGSMGDAAKIILDKMPMFYGQIEKQKYLKDFAMSFAGVGDINSDAAPLQVCDFEKGIKLDKKLKQIYLEGGGGGQTCESYEMMALYYLRQAQFTHPEAQKPFMFIIGDESFYDRVKVTDVRKHLGAKAAADDLETASRKILEDLREKYHVFMLHVPYSCRIDPNDSKGETVVTSDPSVDREVTRKWKEVFREDFIVVKEPKAIVDIILGCIAMVTKTRNLDQYLEDMKGRGQTKGRLERVAESLADKSMALTVRSNAAIAAKDAGLNRGGKSMRL